MLLTPSGAGDRAEAELGVKRETGTSIVAATVPSSSSAVARWMTSQNTHSVDAVCSLA
jgi:hypothetical protein